MTSEELMKKLRGHYDDGSVEAWKIRLAAADRIAALEDENAALEAERDEAVAARDVMRKQRDSMTEKAASMITALEAENARLKAVVEQYESRMFVTADGVRVWPGDPVWHRYHVGHGRYTPDRRPAPDGPIELSHHRPKNCYFSTKEACQADIDAEEAGQ